MSYKLSSLPEHVKACISPADHKKNPIAVAGGKAGGLAKHPRKGFGTPEVLAKAMATRRAKQMAKQIIGGE